MENVYQFIAIAGVILYWLILGAISIRLVTKRRSIGVAFSWLLVIYFIPLLGIFAYMLFGELNLGKTRADRAKAMYRPYALWFKSVTDNHPHRPTFHSAYAESLTQLCLNRLGIPALPCNHLELQTTPAQILGALVDDINAATDSVHMEFYIWHPGGMADKVALASIDAATRGVDVKILLDAAGSRDFFKSHWPESMRTAGVTLTQALKVSPLRMFFRRLDLRLHRKIVVIDNAIGYTGSMNLVDPAYFKQNNHVGQWIDVMVRVNGPVVPVLSAVNAWDWEVETNERELPASPKSFDTFKESMSHGTKIVQVIPSGPGMPDDLIHQVLLQSLYQAQKQITITTPYFVPSENLQKALINAAHRGLEVNIIVPRKNDSTMVKWASRSFFGELLEAGVNIHRFEGGLLHTKSVLIDEEHCLIGTVNLDLRSLWLNFEVTLLVDDQMFAQQLAKLLKEYKAKSQTLENKRWQKRPLYKRFIEHLFYLFSPLL